MGDEYLLVLKDKKEN